MICNGEENFYDDFHDVGDDGMKLKSFEIAGFRKFDRLELPDLSQLNLFVGINDVGKTSLLEAVMGFSCGLNTAPLQFLIFQHRLDDGDDANSLDALANRQAEAIFSCFHQGRQDEMFSFRLTGNVEGEDRYTVSYEFLPSAKAGEVLSYELPEQRLAPLVQPVFQQVQGRNVMVPYLGNFQITILPEHGREIGKQEMMLFALPAYNQGMGGRHLIPAYFNDILGHRSERENHQIYAKLSRSGKLLDFCTEMNRSFPELGIQEIANPSYPDGSQAPVYFRLRSGELRPIYAFGDGVRRWFTILGNMALARDGIQCIEEADATFHHDAQRALARNLYDAMHTYGTQLFLTTHSEEFLQMLLNEMKRRDTAFLRDGVRVITLRDIGGTVRQRTLSGDEAWRALADGLELRR